MSAVTVAGLLGVNVVSAAAASQGALDQEQNQQESGAFYGVGCPGDGLSPVAQTFVAGRTGLLDSVALRLFAGTVDSTPDLQVRVQPATTGRVEATVLSSTTLSPASAQPVTDPVWGPRELVVSFAQPANVTAGQRYALVLAVPAGVGPCPAYSQEPRNDREDVRPGNWGVAVGGSPQAYTNGEVIVGYDGITLDTFAPLNPDIWFRTFVTEGLESPAPLVTSLSPAAVQAGSPAFILTITGVGFTSESQVRWNGASLTATPVSSSQLTAEVPATLVASSGTGTVTVVTGGVPTAPRALFITDTNVSVSSVTTSTSSDAGGTAEVSAGNTTGTATGTGTLTVAHYASNPTTQTFPTGTTAPAYFDVNVSPDSIFSSVTVTVCQLTGSTLYWYDPSGPGWTIVSSQVYDPANGCITAQLTPTTSPNTTQLGGTAFATARLSRRSRP
jgi:hypothetical protein